VDALHQMTKIVYAASGESRYGARACLLVDEDNRSTPCRLMPWPSWPRRCICGVAFARDLAAVGVVHGRVGFQWVRAVEWIVDVQTFPYP